VTCVAETLIYAMTLAVVVHGSRGWLLIRIESDFIYRALAADPIVTDATVSTVHTKLVWLRVQPKPVSGRVQADIGHWWES